MQPPSIQIELRRMAAYRSPGRFHVRRSSTAISALIDEYMQSLILCFLFPDMQQLVWAGLLLALWPDSCSSQPYSYIYFKGPGAKEPTFSFNLTHPGDPLPANRNRPLFSAARFAPTKAPVRVVPTEEPDQLDGTTQRTFSGFSTPSPSTFDVPVFLSEGRFPTSSPRSQRNRASHMRSTEMARSDDNAAFLFPTTKKYPAPRSVPPPSPTGIQSIPSAFDGEYKPFKFPKGKSGIMVRLPGGASYYVDFTPNVLPNQRTSFSPPLTFGLPTSPPTPAVTSSPAKSLTAVTTRSPVFTKQFPTALPPSSSNPGLDDSGNFLFTPSRTPELSSAAVKRPSKFTRPLPTRSPPKQRFQAGIFFLSNGTISSVPSTRKPFGRAKDNFARFNANAPGSRRTTADPEEALDSDNQRRSSGNKRQRGQLGDSTTPIFPNPAAERGRNDDGE